MRCKKRDIARFFPSYIEDRYIITLEQLERGGLSHAVRENNCAGRYVPFCNFPPHRGIILNGLVYLCERKECRYLRRYLESGIGEERVFSTNGSVSNVRPYSRRAKKKK